MSIAKSKALTVKDTAGEAGVHPDKVRYWINSGQLRAINTATNVGGRPRWRVLREDLEDFLRRRSSTAMATPPKQTRVKVVANGKSHF